MRLLTFLFCLFASVAAPAADYCVGSSSALRDALDSAEVDGDDSVVKIRSGTYNLNGDVVYQPAGEFVVAAGKLTVRGGYNSDCSDYDTTSGATRFVSSSGARMSFRTQTGSVTLVAMSFEGTYLTMTSVALGDCLGNWPNFNMRKIRSVGAGVRIVSQCHDVLVENSLFADSVGVPDDGVPAGSAIDMSLVDYDDEIGSVVMTNNTVINGRVNFSSCCGQSAVAKLYNNIFSQSGTELFSDDTNILAKFNRFDPISFTSGGVLLGDSSNNTQAAPGLDANFIPTAGSAMLHSGTGNVPEGLSSIDQTGADRVIGTNVDRGARESPIDGSGIYVVTNTSTSGVGSLPWAIDSANAESGIGTVRFNIAGGCPRIITLNGPLQVRESILIDGWTQPGSVRNSDEVGWNAVPCVVLRGPNSGYAIETMAELDSGRITARGLAFERFELAIGLIYGESHAIQGNQFGGRIGNTATVLAGNGNAIGLVGGGQTRIGGQTAESRNLIGGSSEIGVLITTFLGLGGSDNEVVNNLIGLDKNASTALPNGVGIQINGANNVISDNRIGGNTTDGILLDGQGARGNRIRDNAIGGGIFQVSFTTGNGRMGIMVQGNANNNSIGPGNVIGRNGDDGIRIFSTAGGRNRITGNRVARNDALGIDIGSNGVDDNNTDPSFCDPDQGCTGNRGQNYPEIATAQRRTTGVTPVGRPIEIKGTLRSTIGGPYRIEVFAGETCESNGFGEGGRLIGSFTLTIPNEPYCPAGSPFCVACEDFNCTGGFSVFVSELDVAVGDVVTAAATSSDGNTSEFSRCETVVFEPGPDPLFKNGFE